MAGRGLISLLVLLRCCGASFSQELPSDQEQASGWGIGTATRLDETITTPVHVSHDETLPTPTSVSHDDISLSPFDVSHDETPFTRLHVSYDDSPPTSVHVSHDPSSFTPLHVSHDETLPTPSYVSHNDIPSITLHVSHDETSPTPSHVLHGDISVTPPHVPHEDSSPTFSHVSHDETPHSPIENTGHNLTHTLPFTATPSPPFPVSTQHNVETPTPGFAPHLVIRKCCPLGEVFSHQHAGCVPSGDWTFSVPIFTLDQFGGFIETNVTREQVAVRTGLLECDQQFQLDVYPEQEPSFQFRVLESGWLWVPEYNTEYKPEQYCLETFVQNASDRDSATIMGGAVCVLQAGEPQTFDPEKIPIRKCCHVDMVYHHSEFSCVPRSNVTDEAWLAPIADADPHTDGGNVEMADVAASVYRNTHEVLPDFQTCSGGQRGDVVQVQEGRYWVRAADGHLWLPQVRRFLPPRSYCLEDFYARGALLPSVYVCLSEAEAEAVQQLRTPGCQRQPCLPKCCPRFSLLDRARQTCISERRPAPPPFLHHLNGTLARDTLDADYSEGFPSCSSQYLTASGERAQLLTTGDLRYVSINPDECQQEQVFRVPRGDFCYELVEDVDGTVSEGAVLCFREEWSHLGISSTDKQEVNYVYSVFLAISDFFILVSFIVYLTVADQTQRGLNKNVKLAHSILGRILLCFLFSLFFAFLCLIIIKTASDPINVAEPRACIALGVATYVFFMATFFWLNVLCFELWWKCARQESGSSGRRWLWYQTYAWCCPLLFGAAALIMELTPGVSNCYIKPKFGTYSCFFSFTKTHNNGAKWAYFFGPVAVLLLADLAFFLLTVRSLLRTVKQSHRGTAQRQARQRLRLCFKLFLVMGISWLAEIISFQLGPRTVWYISDVINCFQGFIIFLIFILKPKILEAVRARLCRSCCGSPEPSKVRGTFTFTSFMLSDQTTSISDDCSSSSGARDLTCTGARSFAVSRSLDYDSRGHARASPASSSSSSLSARSVQWRHLEPNSSFISRCMASGFLNQQQSSSKTNKNDQSESSFGSTSTTLSSTRSISSSSADSPSPPLTLSAATLDSRFPNCSVATRTENTPLRNPAVSTRSSLQGNAEFIPIPRPRSTISTQNLSQMNQTPRGQPPDIPPRPSLGEAVATVPSIYNRMRPLSGGAAELQE